MTYRFKRCNRIKVLILMIYYAVRQYITCHDFKPGGQKGPSLLLRHHQRNRTNSELRYHCVSIFTYLQVDDPGHDQRGHQKVSHRQADDQVVGGGLQGFLPWHRHAHQDVAEYDDEDEQREQHGVVVVLMFLLLIGLVEAPSSIVIETVVVSIVGKDIH